MEIYTKHMFCDRIKEKWNKVVGMPRKAREKNSEAIYHIMCRSVSEILLFRDDKDKDYYLRILKNNADKYRCSIYAYCLMSNHLHIHLDPKGYDISKFMHSVNTSYVLYYNKKYNRHGHVFQERFQSRIIDSDRYNLVVSAYIHNNPKDIVKYSGRVEEYEYSSYGIYLGIRKNLNNLVDLSFIQGMMGMGKKKTFAGKYRRFVAKQEDMESLRQFKEDNVEAVQNEYISGRKTLIRGLTPAKVIEYITGKLKHPKNNILNAQRRNKLSEFRAFTAYVLRVLCGLGYRQICENIYNITISGCSRLCNKGFELTSRHGLVYADIFDELAHVNYFSA